MHTAKPTAPLFLAMGLLAAPVLTAHAADVALARLDCGGAPEPRSVAAFSDTFAYPDLQLQLVYSCYLVRHGDRYLLWDTGLDGALAGRPKDNALSDRVIRADDQPGTEEDGEGEIRAEQAALQCWDDWSR